MNQVYPGRASMAPLLDLLMTLLHWGAAGNISLTSNDLAILDCACDQYVECCVAYICRLDGHVWHTWKGRKAHAEDGSFG